MSTSVVVPSSCPTCGFVFGLADVASISAHFTCHLLVNSTMDRLSSDSSKEW